MTPADASEPRVYVETFDRGPGGWFGVVDNFQPPKRLLIQNGVAASYGPWWVDYNHAPPGAGYLQLLMGLPTRGPFGESLREVSCPNHFVEQRFPTDFTNATLTLRLRGELELRGAEVVLLIQGSHTGVTAGWLLTGQPIRVSREWSEQTVLLSPDRRQWTPLGSRHDRTDMYGTVDLETVLADVNVNIYLVLFPVTVVPLGELAGDPHRLRPGRDYPIWTSKLPDGYVLFDTVTIRFCATGSSS
jgi:hypothetical protein